MSDPVRAGVNLVGLVARACGVAFVACFFALVGAFSFVALGHFAGGPDVLAPVCVLAGMAVGALTGLFLCLSFAKLNRLFVRGPVTPPPPEVLRFAAIAGGAEGLVFGAFYGGVAGGVVGGFVGLCFGRAMGASAWQVRQRVGVYIPGLAAGVLVEAGGCLLLGNLLRGFAADPLVVLAAALVPVAAYLLKLVSEPAKKSVEEDFDVPRPEF